MIDKKVIERMPDGSVQSMRVRSGHSHRCSAVLTYACGHKVTEDGDSILLLGRKQVMAKAYLCPACAK